MNSTNDSQWVDAIMVAASLTELAAFRDLLAGGRLGIFLWARNRGGEICVDGTLDDGAVVEIGGRRVGPTQDLPAVRDLLGLLGKGLC